MDSWSGWLCVLLLLWGLSLAFLLPPQELDGVLGGVNSNGGVMLHLLLLPSVTHVPVEMTRFPILLLLTRNLRGDCLRLTNLIRGKTRVV